MYIQHVMYMHEYYRYIGSEDEESSSCQPRCCSRICGGAEPDGEAEAAAVAATEGSEAPQAQTVEFKLSDITLKVQTSQSRLRERIWFAV